MQIPNSNQQPERGIVLAVTLATVAILAIIIASYLTLANQVNSSVSRSQSWNQAIPVLESGLEEALTQLHFAGTNSLLLTQNSWTYGLDGLYHKTRTFSDGTYFNVSIQPAVNPVIISTGYVAVMSASSSTVTNYISRRVKVITQKQAPTPGGINAKGTISMNGNGSLDSFNSADPNYSTGGLYDPAKREANGLALTDSSAAGAVSVGNGTIYGSVATGPTGTASTGANGSVGDLAYVASNSGIEAGHDANNANVQFNDVTAPFPFNKGVTPLSGTVLGTNYTSYLATGSYSMTSISMSSKESMAIIGNAVLYVNGSVSLSGQAYIYIAPGCSLTMYVNGSVSIGGNGIANGTSQASQCTIYGMPGCTSMDMAGNGGFIGTVYAPEADLSFHGNADSTGAFSANTVTIGGNGSIHYDEALGNTGKSYVVISWNEF